MTSSDSVNTPNHQLSFLAFRSVHVPLLFIDETHYH